jgi:hypothetical protein
MDAVSAIIVASGKAQFKNTQKYSLTVALDNICARPPAPWVAWIHQIHAAGRASGSITMAMVFVRSFVLFVRIFKIERLIVPYYKVNMH